MSDNVTARKKLENIEKARRAEEARREKIKAQRLRGVDTSDCKSKL
jgi:cytokinesis protein